MLGHRGPADDFCVLISRRKVERMVRNDDSQDIWAAGVKHSSAALEAVCAGKPVILIGCMAGLAINALENIDNRLWRVVYDAPGLVAALKAWSPEHPLPFELRMALGTEIRNESFEPANDSTMNAFIPGRSARQ